MKIKIIMVIFIVIGFVNNSCYEERNCPEDIEEIFDSFFKQMLRIDPELTTELGVTEEMGITDANDALTDISDNALMQKYKLLSKFRSCLKSYESSELTESQRLEQDILKWYLDMEIKGKPYRYHSYLINQLYGVHNALITLMTEYHPIKTVDDAEDYISRLMEFQTKFEQLQEQLIIRKQKGIIPPRFIIDKVRTEMAGFIRTEAINNLLYTSFAEKIDSLDTITPGVKTDLKRRVEAEIRKTVYPVYRQYIDYLESVQDIATDDAGVWKLPGGDKYYQYCLYKYTTTNLSPKEIHQLGLKAVDRIHQEMMAIFNTLIEIDGKSFGDIVNQYWGTVIKEQKYPLRYPDTEEGKAQVIIDYQKIIVVTEYRLPQLFSLIPNTRVDVKPVPEFKENTMPTHYSPASLDGKRPGVFYANLSSGSVFRPGMQTLTYHEAIPGHHFQFSIQQETPENRKFRNLLYFNGFIEGWALYAERLGMEQGWFTDDYSKIGYLNSELFRAVRLVVDTGIHYKKWSRDRAYKYMVENLGWGSYLEIDRYIVDPGQACAYKVGELNILEMRERAAKELGDKFDIKEFHRLILQNGMIPLEILEQIVNDYIMEIISVG